LNNVATNARVKISFQDPDLNSFGYILRSEIAEYGI
jgi:hypothetical protein